MRWSDQFTQLSGDRPTHPATPSPFSRTVIICKLPQIHTICGNSQVCKCGFHSVISAAFYRLCCGCSCESSGLLALLCLHFLSEVLCSSPLAACPKLLVLLCSCLQGALMCSSPLAGHLKVPMFVALHATASQSFFAQLSWLD